MTSHPARWACPIIGLVLVGVGLLWGRADVALLGVPLVLLVLVNWPTAHHESVTATADTVTVNAGGGTDVVRLRLSSVGYKTTELLIAGRPKAIGASRYSARTGPQPTLVVDWDAHGPCLLTHGEPQTAESPPMVVLPSFIPLGLVPQSRRLRGLTGPMTSTRAGDGFELRDVHPFTSADSLRRIDWKATARQPDDSIWVKGTYATGEAISVLIIDSRDEVGSDLHAWNASVPLRVDEPTSLDLARNAAASIARTLIEAGGRVGLADLATGRRTMTPTTGRRHLSRLMYSLALSAPVGSSIRRVRAPYLPAGAIIYLFTTLLDDESLRLVHTMKESGHDVLVVDTLPAIRPVAEQNLTLAWRILRAERTARILFLAGEQVPVIAWIDPTRDRALAAIERSAVIRR